MRAPSGELSLISSEECDATKLKTFYYCLKSVMLEGAHCCFLVLLQLEEIGVAFEGSGTDNELKLSINL